MSLKNNKEVFSEVVVGVFMTAVLGLLIYFTIIISGIEVFNGKSRVPVKVIFHDVGGLKLRDSVVLRGMTVGSVNDMELQNSGVTVTLMVQGAVRFKEGYTISVCAGSLLGGNYLLIEEGSGKELPRETVLAGQSPSNWMRDLSAIVANLKEATAGDHIKNIITNLDAAVSSIKVAVARVEEGKGTLGKLFSDDNSLYNDLSNTVVNLKSITTKIDVGENSLGRLLNDTGGMYTNLNASIANLKSISDRLEKGEGTLGKLIKDDNKIYNDLDATVANLKTVTDRLVKGEGTLGKLSADDKLYNEVQGLITDVRQTVDNFRDTTPISAFASLLVGGL
jgi:phospholipid/cholesterol/gamma-HCH transport system substrate-binding protein